MADETNSQNQQSEYNPNDYTVEEVVEYLGSASPEEVERVQQAEAEGKNRKGIAEYSASSDDEDDSDDEGNFSEAVAAEVNDDEDGEELKNYDVARHAPEGISTVTLDNITREVNGLGVDESPTLATVQEHLDERE